MTRALFNFRLTCMSFAMLLAGCTVGPDFHSPTADVPSQWHDPQRTAAGASASSDASVASVPTLDTDPEPRWWRNFSDPTLDALIERAARSNLDLQEAVLRIAEARTQVQSAAAQGLPNVRHRQL